MIAHLLGGLAAATVVMGCMGVFTLILLKVADALEEQA